VQDNDEEEDEIEEEEEEEEIVEDEAVEEDEVSIPLHHIAEEQEIEEEEPQPVPIRPVYPEEIAPTAPVAAPRYIEPTRHTHERREEQVAPDARIITERIVTKKRGARRTRTSNAPVIALLLSVSLCVVAVTVIGTGYADNYLQTLGDENPIVNFIHGTSEFKR
jgi:hypothetical protein